MTVDLGRKSAEVEICSCRLCRRYSCSLFSHNRLQIFKLRLPLPEIDQPGYARSQGRTQVESFRERISIFLYVPQQTTTGVKTRCSASHSSKQCARKGNGVVRTKKFRGQLRSWHGLPQRLDLGFISSSLLLTSDIL